MTEETSTRTTGMLQSVSTKSTFDDCSSSRASTPMRFTIVAASLRIGGLAGFRVATFSGHR
jgi:hypothetical protein